MRYYIGVDWGDAEHAVWVEDDGGTKVMSRALAQTVAAFAEWGRWLDDAAPRASSCGRRSNGRTAGSWTPCSIMAWWCTR
jgi:hypothetical protein